MESFKIAKWRVNNIERETASQEIQIKEQLSEILLIVMDFSDKEAEKLLNSDVDLVEHHLEAFLKNIDFNEMVISKNRSSIK